MRIFALETNIEKIKKSFIAPNEKELLTFRSSGLAFFLRSIPEIAGTAVLIVIGVYAEIFGAPIEFVAPILGLIWLILIFPPFFRAFINWQFDATVLTNAKLILLDQSLFFQRITPISLANIASVSTETQLANIFPFGRVVVMLEENGALNKISYIAGAEAIAVRISDAITAFQQSISHHQRKLQAGQPHTSPATHAPRTL